MAAFRDVLTLRFILIVFLITSPGAAFATTTDQTSISSTGSGIATETGTRTILTTTPITILEVTEPSTAIVTTTNTKEVSSEKSTTVVSTKGSTSITETEPWTILTTIPITTSPTTTSSIKTTVTENPTTDVSSTDETTSEETESSTAIMTTTNTTEMSSEKSTTVVSTKGSTSITETELWTILTTIPITTSPTTTPSIKTTVTENPTTDVSSTDETTSEETDSSTAIVSTTNTTGMSSEKSEPSSLLTTFPITTSSVTMLPNTTLNTDLTTTNTLNTTIPFTSANVTSSNLTTEMTPVKNLTTVVTTTMLPNTTLNTDLTTTNTSNTTIPFTSANVTSSNLTTEMTPVKNLTTVVTTTMLPNTTLNTNLTTTNTSDTTIPFTSANVTSSNLTTEMTPAKNLTTIVSTTLVQNATLGDNITTSNTLSFSTTEGTTIHTDISSTKVTTAGEPSTLPPSTITFQTTPGFTTETITPTIAQTTSEWTTTSRSTPDSTTLPKLSTLSTTGIPLTSLTTSTTTTTVLPTTVENLQRMSVVPHLLSSPSTLEVDYFLGFMDDDLANSTRMRVKETTGLDEYGPFYGGLINDFTSVLPKQYENTNKRSSLELLAGGNVYVYMSTTIMTKSSFLCYPLTALDTDYVIMTMDGESTILITSSQSDTEVFVFFQESWKFGDYTYDFNSPLRLFLDDLETYVITNISNEYGIYVKSTKPLAVMMELGSISTSECFSRTYLPPLSKWGLEFSFVTSRQSTYNFRIFAAYDNTEINLTASSEECNLQRAPFTLHAMAIEDFKEIANCSIDITANQPIAILLTEVTFLNACKTMVVPSTDKAISKMPVFVDNAANSLRVWVSDGNEKGLLLDDQPTSWEKIDTGDSEYAVFEGETAAGYHTISSTEPNSRLLVVLNNALFAAHDIEKEIRFESCLLEYISFKGVQLTFRGIIPGETMNSTQNCSNDSSKANESLATRECTESGWEDPILTECYTSEEAMDKIEEIANKTVTEDNVEEVADELALVTTQTDDLHVDEINNVAHSLEAIAETNSSSPEVTESVVGTVNNLMELEEEELEQAESTASVVSSLEQQVSNVQESPDNFTDVQDNVGVKAVKLDPDITNGVTFLNIPSTNASYDDILNADLDADGTQLHNSPEEVKRENSTSSIYLSMGVLELAIENNPNSSQIPVSFSIFKDSRLFQTSQTNLMFSSTDNLPQGNYEFRRQVIASQVIAATVEGVVVENLTGGDLITTRFIIKPTLGENETVFEQRCVYWKEIQNSNGQWVDDGCQTTVDDNRTVCTCNHLTNFAVLVGIGEQLPDAVEKALDVITITGSCLSIAGLTACVLTLSLIKPLRVKQTSQIHLNLCVSLVAFYICFLSSDLASGNNKHCKNISSAIHYFCLATVGWMSVEAVNMYLLFVKYKRDDVRFFIPVSAALVYGLSLIPVIAVAVIEDLATYTNAYACFLPKGKSLYFGFILEVLIMVAFNILIFTLVLRNVVFRPMLSTTSKRNKKREMFSRMQQFVLFWMLLGLSWIFGFLAMIPERKTVALEILFCIFTSIQGFALFIFICLKNPEVKKKFLQTKSYLTGYTSARGAEKTTSGSKKSTTWNSREETSTDASDFNAKKRPPSPALSTIDET